MGETVNGRYSVCVCDSEIGMLGEWDCVFDVIIIMLYYAFLLLFFKCICLVSALRSCEKKRRQVSIIIIIKSAEDAFWK